MKLHLSHNFRRNRKGVSTIFGMVFFLLIVVIVFASFAVVLDQSTRLEGTIIQTRQVDNDKGREQLVIVNTDTDHPSYDGTTLSCSVINIGTISAQIVRIWVEDSNLNSASVNVASKPGSLVAQNDQSPTLSGTAISSGTTNPDKNGILRYWCVTARGTQFSLQTTGAQGEPGADGNKWYNDESTLWSRFNPPTLFTFGLGEHVGDYYLNTKTRDLYVRDATTWRWIVTLPKSAGQAGVAQGIGSIAMDFPEFKIYTFIKAPKVNDLLPAPSSFTVSKSSYLIFKVAIWNVDPDGRPIVLSSESRIWASITQQSTMKSGSWNLIQVDSTGKITSLSSPASIPLPYTDDTETTLPTVLYFGITQPSTMTNDFPQTVPINILLYGGIDGGTNNYGQNLPFVSIKIT